MHVVRTVILPRRVDADAVEKAIGIDLIEKQRQPAVEMKTGSFRTLMPS